MDDSTLKMLVILTAWINGYVFGDMKLLSRLNAWFWKSYYEIRYPDSVNVTVTIDGALMEAALKWGTGPARLMWNGEELVPDYNKSIPPMVKYVDINR